MQKKTSQRGCFKDIEELLIIRNLWHLMAQVRYFMVPVLYLPALVSTNEAFWCI